MNDKAVSVLAVCPDRIDFVCPEGELGTRLSISVENEAGHGVIFET